MRIRIAFASNFINHHQMPFCDEMYKRLGDDFSFIQAQPMDEGRVNMGWQSDIGNIGYLHKLYEEKQECLKLIEECDILLLGWTGLPKEDPAETVIRERLKLGKPVIRISERIYREGRYKAVSPRGLLAKYDEHIRHRKSRVYLLCAGAYVSGDFQMIGAYPGKMFKWGYFPPLKRYDEEQLSKILYKDGESLEICFAGRLIKLKHPEFLVYAAKHLKEKGISFKIHVAGDGPLRPELEKMVSDSGVSENVIFYGSTFPENVRKLMEKCHIFLFCSNFLEGWGAVVNEAMNSACAVIASGEAGAVPYLIKNGENGIIYNRCDEDDFLKCLDLIADNGDMIRMLQRNAYKTIVNEWNAEHACEELLKFCEGIMSDSRDKTTIPEIPASGPMSKATVIPAPGFLRTLKEDNHLE